MQVIIKVSKNNVTQSVSLLANCCYGNRVKRSQNHPMNGSTSKREYTVAAEVSQEYGSF